MPVKHVLTYEEATRYFAAFIAPRKKTSDDKEFSKTVFKTVLEYNKPTSPEDMRLDFHRTPFFNGTNVAKFLQPWQSSSTDLPYSQGDWMGGNCSELVIQRIATADWTTDDWGAVKNKNPSHDEWDFLCGGYLSDDNPQKISGIRTTWLKNHPDVWMISILKDPDKAVKLKDDSKDDSKDDKQQPWKKNAEVTIFCSDACERFVKSRDKTEIQRQAHADTQQTVRYDENAALFTDIQKAIGSKQVCAALGSFISNGAINVSHLKTTILELAPSTGQVDRVDRWKCCATTAEDRHWLKQFYLAGLLEEKQQQDQYALQVIDQLIEVVESGKKITLTPARQRFIQEHQASLLAQLPRIQEYLNRQAPDARRDKRLAVCEFLNSAFTDPTNTKELSKPLFERLSNISTLHRTSHSWPWQKEWWTNEKVPTWKKGAVILCAAVVGAGLTFATFGGFLLGFGVFAGLIAVGVGLGTGILGLDIKERLGDEETQSINTAKKTASAVQERAWDHELEPTQLSSNDKEEKEIVSGEGLSQKEHGEFVAEIENVGSEFAQERSKDAIHQIDNDDSSAEVQDSRLVVVGSLSPMSTNLVKSQLGISPASLDVGDVRRENAKDSVQPSSKSDNPAALSLTDDSDSSFMDLEEDAQPPSVKGRGMNNHQ